MDNDAVPLGVGLVVFVSLVFNHSVAADANVWPGYLHPIQCDPATHKNTSFKERKGDKQTDRDKETTKKRSRK